jgi:hypothetical protein
MEKGYRQFFELDLAGEQKIKHEIDETGQGRVEV